MVIDLKRTSLYEKHQELGGKMVPFAGYEMPVQYSGIMDEHLTVREKVGIFDLSHMGEFEIRGKDTEAFLQRMTINDVSQLGVGQAQYTAMCYETGGIVDDCILYRLENHYLLVVNAANIEKDWQWLEDNLGGRVSLHNVSDETTLIAVQGPESREVLRKVFDDSITVDELKFYHVTETTIHGIPLLCTRTGYTGELGYELYVKDRSGAMRLWDEILLVGEQHGIKPIGLGARDSLRLEMKYCLYGNDIDETTNPIEAGLGWITKVDTDNFIGKEAILNVKQNKPNHRLVTFELIERGIPRQGYKIFSEGNEVGLVTSGGHSPSLKKGIGLGYVLRKYAKSSSEIQIEIRQKFIKARIVKPPFWKQGSLMK